MSKIMFRTVAGPTIDGVPDEAILTEDEVDAICVAIDSHSDIVEDLRNYAELVNQWRASDDTLQDTWLPDSTWIIQKLVIEITNRPNTGALTVYATDEFMQRKGWIAK